MKNVLIVDIYNQNIYIRNINTHTSLGKLSLENFYKAINLSEINNWKQKKVIIYLIPLSLTFPICFYIRK